MITIQKSKEKKFVRTISIVSQDDKNQSKITMHFEKQNHLSTPGKRIAYDCSDDGEYYIELPSHIRHFRVFWN